MKKPIRYSLGILAVLLILFLSLDIQKLDEYKAADTTVYFSAKEYAGDVWENELPEVINRSAYFLPLVNLLQNNPETAFTEFGKKLGISKTWYFMAKDEGIIKSIEEENLLIEVNGFHTRIATSFIFGNAIRDGSGAVDIDEFLNMTDFNNVSIEINNLVKNNVVPILNKNAKPGMKLEFAGAFEIKEDDVDVQSIRIIPVSVNLSDGNNE
jgi:predicted lipoprotein